MPTALEKAETAKKIARAKFMAAEADYQRACVERRASRLTGDEITNEYDATTDAANKRRRTAKVERGPESSILTQHKRLKGINLARNLLRNFTSAKAIDHQRTVNVVGVGPKLKLHTGDEDADTRGQDYFNKVWAKDCDSRDDVPWNEEVSLILSASGTDGGCIIAVDDFDRNDGKLITWTTDQMVTIDATDWTSALNDSDYEQWTEEVPVTGGTATKQMMQQGGGYVRDYRGRVMGYVVTAKPGQMTAKLKDVTILARNTVARMVKRPWRLNQLVPVPEYLPMVADLEDLYEGRTSALQTWKKAAKIYAYVKSISKQETALTDSGLESQGTVEDQSEDAEATSRTENYEALEDLTGGFTDYGDPDDEVMIPKASEKSDDKMEPFFDACLLPAGASVGLARAFTNLKAETSYTAFRGETVMTWTSFEVDQKWLERRACDWIAVKVLTWAQSSAGPLAALPKGWELKVKWGWPKMKTLDPAKENKAIAQGLKLPNTDWEELLGPEWKKRLTAYSEQLKFIKTLELPLSVFETVAGAPVETDSTGDD